MTALYVQCVVQFRFAPKFSVSVTPVEAPQLHRPTTANYLFYNCCCVVCCTKLRSRFRYSQNVRIAGMEMDTTPLSLLSLTDILLV